jgi:hypothetical protein
VLLEERGGNITIETEYDICNENDTDVLKAIMNDLEMEVNNLLKTDEDEQVSVVAKCNEERLSAVEEITNNVSVLERRRRSINSTQHLQLRFVLSGNYQHSIKLQLQPEVFCQRHLVTGPRNPLVELMQCLFYSRL